MKERIDIVVPEPELALNQQKKERLERTHRFEPTDRVPVVVYDQLAAVLAGRKSRFSEMIKNPREHLRGLILNYKWRCENIRDDLPIETERLIVEQDFGALRGAEFPLEIVFPGDDPPKTTHLLRAPEEIDRLTIPEPDGGHNRLRLEWYRAMSSLASEFDVRINGEPLEIAVTINHAGGPMPSAFALCGANLFLWLATDPERIHRLMEIVTASHLRCLAYFDEIKGVASNHPIWLGADSAEMISPAKFREFVVPYYVRVWERYPYERNFHMCGKIDHLLAIIRDEMRITYLDGFGFPTSRRLLAEQWAGRIVMRGGPHPVLIKEGPADRIVEECSDYIRTLAKKGGYILCDGYGLAAETPPEHIDAMVEASKRVGWVGGDNHN